MLLSVQRVVTMSSGVSLTDAASPVCGSATVSRSVPMALTRSTVVSLYEELPAHSLCQCFTFRLL